MMCPQFWKSEFFNLILNKLCVINIQLKLCLYSIKQIDNRPSSQTTVIDDISFTLWSFWTIKAWLMTGICAPAYTYLYSVLPDHFLLSTGTLLLLDYKYSEHSTKLSELNCHPYFWYIVHAHWIKDNKFI